jgi:hypothetical protein
MLPLKRWPVSNELVLYWTVGKVARCVLVSDEECLNLQILHEGSVVRHEAVADPRNARDLARRWHIDYDLIYGTEPEKSADPPCPACGDRASAAYVIHKGFEQRACRTCGHDWSVLCAQRVPT